MLVQKCFKETADLQIHFSVVNRYCCKWIVLFVLLLCFLVIVFLNFLVSDPVSYDIEKSKLIEDVHRCTDYDCLQYKPFNPYVSLYYAVPEYHISYCAVQGVYEYMAENMICYLYDSEYFLESNTTFELNHPVERPCHGRNKFLDVVDVKIHLSHDVNHLFIYQEPFLRFTKAYVSLCLMNNRAEYCFNCAKNDLMCFVRRFRNFITEPMIVNHEDPTFVMFMKIAPQTWYCEIAETHKDITFIQLGASASERENTFDKIYEFLIKRVPIHKADYARSVLRKEKKTQRFVENVRWGYMKWKLNETLLNDKIIEDTLFSIYRGDIELFKLKDYGPQYVHRILSDSL